ncbi:MAG: hypothetical protein QM764_14055 [Chitinophagaceae bacterium]
MKLYSVNVLTVLFFFTICSKAFAQDKATDMSAFDGYSGYIDKISTKAADADHKIDQLSEKALQKFLQKQQRLHRKLYKVDSLSAGKMVTDAAQRYKSFEQKLSNPAKATQYIPFLDTLKTSLKFLNKNKDLLAKVKDSDTRIKESLAKVDGLEQQLQKAEEIKKFLQQEKQLLKDQLAKFGTDSYRYMRQLKGLNKDVYYYSQQVNEYKEAIKDPRKIERKAIDMLSRTRVFQDFMKKNSMLASLFRAPSGSPEGGEGLGEAFLAGLQTRASVNTQLQNQFGNNTNVTAQLQNNVQQAQGQLQQLKDKITKAGGSSSDDNYADGFKPNNQRTKTFLQRL